MNAFEMTKAALEVYLIVTAFPARNYGAETAWLLFVLVLLGADLLNAALKHVN
jgi:hypothetical protein